MNAHPAQQRPGAAYWSFLKWIVFVVVLIFVVRRAIQLWASAPATPIRIEGTWLILAGIAYFIGWLPSVWFWRALIRTMNRPLSWRDALRAYYIGHLGKYVPGKALVLFIRGSLLKDTGINPLFAGTAAVQETLVLIATGSALGLALAPMAIGEPFWSRFPASLIWLRDSPLLFAGIVIAATFATTPFSSWLFTQMSRKTILQDEEKPELPSSVSAGLISLGVLTMSLGWACHAFSLGFVIRSITHQPFDVAQFPLWLAATAISMVGGFVVLIAPGGIGVREGLLIELLKNEDQVGPANAIVVAGVLRAVWFATELIAAGILFVAKKRH